MAEIEQLTTTVPTETAAIVKRAISDGDYASASDVVRDALRDWTEKRGVRAQDLASLKADIEHGLADAEAGRVKAFDIAGIVARGRALRSNGRSV